MNVNIWRRKNKLLNSFDKNDCDNNEEEDVGNYTVSCSMPNVMVTKNELNNEDSFDKIDLIPSNLPPLRTDRRDGTFFFFENLNYLLILDWKLVLICVIVMKYSIALQLIKFHLTRLIYGRLLPLGL